MTMTDYALLTPNDQQQLLAERVRELEADHFRQSLLLLEVEGFAQEDGIRVRIAEIERRLHRHLSVPTEPEATEPNEPSTTEVDHSAVERNGHHLNEPSTRNDSLDPQEDRSGG